MKRRRIEIGFARGTDALEDVICHLRKCFRMAENPLWVQLRPDDVEGAEKNENEGKAEAKGKEVKTTKPY
ncbi:MAG: hypothetical protein GY820_20115 [Gammaproteobacteria bacterium]|nr:hypothetical protein [Gammaproteobacteria bacterium]